VRLVVPDTSFLLSAFLSPNGQRRKLLIVLAYGYFSYYAQVGIDEIDAVRHEAEHSETAPGGRDIEELVGGLRRDGRSSRNFCRWLRTI